MCVAGVYTPAFVERDCLLSSSSSWSTVSLGFTPQPLLSADLADEIRMGIRRVAGVYTPAFVERIPKMVILLYVFTCRWGLYPSLC